MLKGFVPEEDEDHKSAYVLKLKKNLYGLKQASFNWFDKLKAGLVDRGFKASVIDPCLYYKKWMIVITYADDCIIVGNNMRNIDNFVRSMQNGKENFDLTDEGLIDNDWKAESNTKNTPVGKPGNTCPGLSMATHQIARFCIDPRLSQKQAIMQIGRYLLGTADQGIIHEPDPKKGLECYVDADLAGGWAEADTDDAETVMSRTGYVIFYAGCPVYWVSKLQSEIALSTAEAEYIALSTALREVIPLMTLMKEIDSVFPLYIDKPNFFCKIFEDNQSCIKMAVAPKMTPRTKHIALKYNHFKRFVGNTIDIRLW
eukprot:scaffold74624_cov50-Cyclotella_meneghiniana.AAC.2